jgi:hypothetical protein
VGMVLCVTGWSSMRSNPLVQQQSTCWCPPGDALSQIIVTNSVTDTIYRPLRIPLSSFIVEDMMEYVHAHATYRFILHDDEEERPRILVRRTDPKPTARISYRLQIWLFKPSMRIAYATPTQYFLSKVGSIHGAKVLYRILGPETASTDIAR